MHGQGLSHNAISPESCFIGKRDRRWLLGGLGYVTQGAHLKKEVLKSIAKCLPSNYSPPEDTQVYYNDISPFPRDIFCLGKLMRNIVSALALSPDSSKVFDWIELQLYLDIVTSPDPSRRPSATNFLDHRFFSKNSLLFTESLIVNIRNMTIEQKSEGFR